MKSIKLIFLLLFSLSIFSQNNFFISIDSACFITNDSLGYIDIFYAFHQDQMRKKYAKDDTSISGLLTLQIDNINSKENYVNRRWSFNQSINKNNENINNNALIGVVRFELPSGKYACNIIGKDGIDTLKQSSYSFDFVIDTLKKNTFSLSDIQLASTLQRSYSNQKSMFYKNNYEVVPNPNLTFGHSVPVVFLYIEIYDFSKNANTDALKLEFTVSNSYGDTLTKKTKFLPTSLKSMVFADAINVSKFVSGKYDINVNVSDVSRAIKLKKQKKFFVYNPDIIDNTEFDSSPDVLASEFAGYNEEEIDEILESSLHIATLNEIEKLESLNNIKDKKVFLYHFWKSRDDDPYSDENKIKYEYFRRVAIANERYAKMGKKGFASDRGRVICLYGEPSEIERFPSDIEKKPYEKWTYYRIEGGVIFIFADLYGFSDYSLIHSTKRGELKDDNWDRKIKTE